MSDLRTKLASADSIEQETSGSTDDDGPDFAGNQTADGYLIWGDPKAVTAATDDALGIDHPNINTYRLTREDIPSLRKQAEKEEWHPNAAKWAIEAAMKSWLGERQRELNEEFGIGLEKEDGVVTGFQSNQYAAEFGRTLPTLEWEEVTADEMAMLEEHGAETDTLGFRSGVEGDLGPVMPVLEGVRWPVFVQTFEELDEHLDRLESFPDEPTLGNIEEGDEETGDSEAEFPMLANGTLEDIDADLAKNEYSSDELKAMLEFERANQNRKGGVDRLESAIEDASDDGGSEAASAFENTDEATAEDRIQAFNNLVEAGVDAEEAAERAGI